MAGDATTRIPDAAETPEANIMNEAITEYSVPDISCQHCIDSITTEVSAVDGVTSVVVDLETKTVAVAGGDAASIVAAIDEAGYDVG